jgi:hypothetical protein
MPVTALQNFLSPASRALGISDDLIQGGATCSRLPLATIFHAFGVRNNAC